MLKKIGILSLLVCLGSSVHAQDIAVSNAEEQETAEVADLQTEPDYSYIDKALMRSWRHNHPFKQVSEEQIAAANADTALITPKKGIPYYSDAKRSADSLMAQVNCVPFEAEKNLGQVDYRFPVFNTGKIPAAKQPTIVDVANDYSAQKWDYVAPANAQYVAMQQNQNMREMATYAYAKQHPSRFNYARGSMDIPPTSGIEVVSAVKSLEGKSLEVGESAAALTQVGLIQSQIKTDVWHFKGSSSVQMAQTALSDNWYKGGDNNMTASTLQKIEISNYDENKKTTFDVLLELRLSALYTTADTVNSLRVNDNQFSATIKYGYQAWKRWYYSTSLYAKTPILDYHNANSRVTKSTFLAPLEANVSVGLEYKYQSANKKVQYSLLLAPLAYNLKYIATDRVNGKNYGLEEGEKVLNKFGATVNSQLTWQIHDNLQWISRLYYFTSYDNIQVEFENTFNLNISRRFTCTLYLYPRFDDILDDKIQMKQMLSFGFNYVW